MGVQEVLDDLGIHRFDVDIRTVGRDELAVHFGTQETGRIKLAPLVRSILYNAYERIQDGHVAPIYGNVRSLYYEWVKPTFAHIHDDDEAKTHPYDVMVHEMRDMALDHGLFQYRDFDLTDENFEVRRIGERDPHVLVFSEKTGWIRSLRRFHKELGCSTLALGGAPSALTSEYTARDIFQATGGPTALQLVGIVDYDPSGDVIARSFADQLRAVGVPETHLELVVHPRHYTPEAVELFKFPLSSNPRMEKKNAKWLEKTGGIGGELYGLEAESMPREKVHQLVADQVEAAKTRAGGRRG